MVQRADLADIRRNAKRVGAGASSAAAIPRKDLQIVYLPIERLRAFPNNARTHSKKQLKQIARSIERFGFVNPVLISDAGEIVAGHGRVEAAKMLGMREVPTVRLRNLSPAERRAYVLADNRLAQLAGWDREVLAGELQGLLDVQFDDIELTGFSLETIGVLDDATVEETVAANDRRAAKRVRPAVSRPGDLWLLGPHQLRCGDEPMSCDDVVRHWQRSTGRAARLVGEALTFAEAEASRTGQDAPRGTDGE